MSNWTPPVRWPWMDSAECAKPGNDPDTWFPRIAEWRGDVAKAVAICNRCPVQVECLHHALTEPHVADGIWGGLTGDQIRALRRRARRKP